MLTARLRGMKGLDARDPASVTTEFGPDLNARLHLIKDNPATALMFDFNSRVCGSQMAVHQHELASMIKLYLAALGSE